MSYLFFYSLLFLPLFKKDTTQKNKIDFPIMSYVSIKKAPCKYSLTCFTTPNIFIVLEGGQSRFIRGESEPMIMYDYKGGGGKIE